MKLLQWLSNYYDTQAHIFGIMTSIPQHTLFLLIEVERRNQKFQFNVFYARFCR